jgi:sugar phosphate permease
MDERRRWTILAVGTFAQAATCAFLYGIPMLVPAFRAEGSSLFGASLLVAAPMVGLLLTLIGWGALADRYGERIVIVTGVGIAAGLLVVAALVHGTVALGVLFVLAGAFAASVNAASGRVVMGWFPVSERGLAMGTRQTAQPLGVALAALGLPALAHTHGAHHALLFPAALCAAAAVLVLLLVTDPPRPARSASAAPARSPYRGSSDLPRVHLASAMLVVPQFAVSAFTLVYLVSERGWDSASAGRLVFGFQIAGALGRVVTGVWSDRVGSRLRPMRQLAVASACLMVAISVGAATGSVVAVLAFAAASVVTVADNGLAYVSVAEFAGREWSGRALGAQNTVQNFAAIVTAPVLAAAIGDTRFAIGFAIAAVCPVLAVPLTPVRAERRRRSTGEDVAGADVVTSEVGQQ